MKNFNVFLLVSVLAICLNACDRPDCRNRNAQFDRYAPESREYKLELAKEIRRLGANGLRYWFDHNVVREGKEYILVNVQGDGVCALGEIRVKDWNGIQGLKNGGGYHGAELDGLRIGISENSEDVLAYEGLDHIVD